MLLVKSMGLNSYFGTLTRQVSYFEIELLIGDGTDYGWYNKIYNQAI